MKSFEDKVVVITGSADGIGFALAKQFGLDGAKVVISDIAKDKLQVAVAALSALNIEITSFVCDVTSRSEVQALADCARLNYGRVDVLVNNAGVSQQPARLMSMDLDDFRRVYEVNVYGVLNGIQVFGQLFLNQGTPAAVYNLGSENSIYPCVPSSHAYVSSKHAVLAVTELLAEEVPDYIDVALIMPGLVDTNMCPDFFEGMNVDEFAGLVLKQLKAGELYVVSHSYNKVRLEERHAKISKAYDNYAPRHEGDDRYDIRSLIEGMS
jgi:NAD(P)-dependent dehydrogenase (short-subunit alcohol dehydrogenase family)